MNKNERFQEYFIYLNQHRGTLPRADAAAHIQLLLRLEDMLTEGVVCFTFIKKDGSVRKAYGTKAQDIIEKRCSGKSTTNSKPFIASTYSYFDLEKEDWRCFKIETLKEINNDYAL